MSSTGNDGATLTTMGSTGDGQHGRWAALTMGSTDDMGSSEKDGHSTNDVGSTGNDRHYRRYAALTTGSKDDVGSTDDGQH